MPTITRDAVINRMADLANDQREKMMRSGKAKSDEQMIRAMVKAAKENFDADEMIDDLLANVAERKLKGNMKQHGWSAALKSAEHGDLFPDALDHATISIGGSSMPFVCAEPGVMDDQVNAVIDNKISVDRAYVRSMETLRPIQALQQELGITVGEALAILRTRSK